MKGILRGAARLLLAVLVVDAVLLAVLGLLRWRGLLLLPKEAAPDQWEVFGVDVSAYQGVVDWPVLAGQGVDDFAPLEDAPWQVFLHEDAVFGSRLQEEPGGPESAPGAPTLPVDREALDFVYPHLAACTAPTKLTATQLKGREKDREIVQETIQPYVRREFSAPRFLSGQRPLTGAERGTATHLVMQYLPLKEDTDVRTVVEDLASRRFLTREQADAVDQTAIRRFLASPLAAELRKADHVEREFRFSLLMPGERYFPELAGGEEVMLQGVVDLYAEKDGAVTVVDFKTDYVTEDTIAEKAAHYRPQLEAYSAALEKILELPVKRRVLYFFSAGRTMEV